MLNIRSARLRALPIACCVAASLLFSIPRLATANSVGKTTQEKTPTEIQISFSFVSSTPAQAKKHPQLQALLESGGKVFAAPSIRTLDAAPAELKTSQQIPYLIGSGDNAKATTYETGLRVRVVPRLNPDKTVQLDFDADNSEPTSKPGKPLAVAKYGVFNIARVKVGQETVVGTWMQQGKLVTVFATVTLPSAQSGE